MEDHHEHQVFRRPSQESIANCLRDELNIPLATDTHSNLLASIEEKFETYSALEEGRLEQPALKHIDAAISALEKVRPYYLDLQDLKPSKLRELSYKGLRGEDASFPIKDTKERRRRQRKIETFQKDLVRLRKKFREIVQTISPPTKMAFKKPINWLTWALCKLLEEELPYPNILKKQIYYAVYQLLRHSGIERKDHTYPEKTISERVRRFSKMVNSSIN